MQSLADHGVDLVFGYPGGAILPLYDEMVRHPNVRHVLVRHEQCAAHMADGYARVTGKVGVCIATSGPGATNLVTGIANAAMDGIPMLAITGQVARKGIGKDAFQETDIQGVTLPITKHNYLVPSVDCLPEILEEAFDVAGRGRKGPVLVDIPKDVLQAASQAKTAKPKPQDAQKPDPEQIRIAWRMIQNAKRPVAIAGAGVLHAGASNLLKQLAERCDIPVASSLLGLGAIGSSHPLCLGMMGMHGRAAPTLAVQKADLVLGIGIRFDDRLTGETAGFAPKAQIIHFDIDPCEVGKTVSPDAFVLGDLGQTLTALLELAQPRQRPEWRQQIEAWQAEFPVVVPKESGLVMRHVLHRLDQKLNGQAIVATDVGQHQMWAAQMLRFDHPRSWISSGGLGTMGFGFPAAMGAKFAQPHTEVWAIVGDGGFQMTLQELQTAQENSLDVKICLLNNGYLGMVRQWQELFYENRLSHVLLGNPDYQKLAEAYAVGFARCTEQDQIDETIEAARSHKGPFLCEFQVQMEENLFPMVPPGSHNSDLVMDPALPQAVAK